MKEASPEEQLEKIKKVAEDKINASNKDIEELGSFEVCIYIIIIASLFITCSCIVINLLLRNH